MYKLFFKRVIDIIVSFIGLLITAPIIILVTFILAIVKKGNPFFFQQRPGFHGKIFKLYKFSTMKDLYDEEGKPLPDIERITKVGKFIRSASLDELPQLLNVLKGDMSLIGPRPLLVKYLPLYNAEQSRRHEVKPGITGWAQVNGRNAISWTEKFKLDVWYVDHFNFILDIKIIFLTFKKVIIREGINSNVNKTMSTFEGNK